MCLGKVEIIFDIKMNVTEQQLNLSSAGMNADETFYCGKVWIPGLICVLVQLQ